MGTGRRGNSIAEHGLHFRARIVAFLIGVVVATTGCATQFTSTDETWTALPNEVSIGPRLVTAGQPSRQQLHRLKERGFTKVIHLLIAGRPAGVDDELTIVHRAGLEYVQLAVDLQALGAADLQQMAQHLRTSTGHVVLVHCESNVVASAFVFLYRVTHLKGDARQALHDLERSPIASGTVRAFMVDQLRASGVELELY